MNYFNRYIACIALVCCFCYSPAQEKHRTLREADLLYEKKAYAEAIPRYIKFLKRDSAYAPAITRIAECYRMINDIDKAERWYRRAVALKEADPVNLLYYGQVLIQNRKYKEARYWLTQYGKRTTGDTRAQNMITALDHISDYFKDSLYFRIARLNINSIDADFSPVIYKDGLIFTSSRKLSSPVNRKDSQTGKNFFSIYFASKKGAITFNEPVLFTPGLQSRYNNGPVSVSSDLSSMYFTRNDAHNENNDEAVKLKIYQTTMDKDGSFRDDALIPFEYNTSRFSCAHPSISSDGNKLYFSSDMPGGYGGMDIYVCTREGLSWGFPVNLGPAVNTKGNEVFPYVYENNTLFFSSDGHGGLGGLDIFVSHIHKNKWAKPENTGFPINSNMDDFGLVIHPNGEEGYFSSNRTGNGLDDDIYHYYTNVHKTLLQKGKNKNVEANSASSSALIKLNGNVANVNDQSGLEGVIVELRHKKHAINSTVTIDGSFAFDSLQRNAEYELAFIKAGFATAREKISTKGIPGENLNVSFYMDKDIHLMLDGMVLDKNKPEGKNDSLVLLDITHLRVLPVKSKKNGYFQVELEKNSEYELYAVRNKLKSNTARFSTAGNYRSKVFSAVLQMGAASACEQLKKKYFIENIYFDLNTSTLREDALTTLNKLLGLLKSTADLTVTCSADLPGVNQINGTLMQQRGSAVKDYLTSRGIQESRIKLSFADGQIKSTCPANLYCPEKEPQLGRSIRISLSNSSGPVTFLDCAGSQ